MFVGIALVGFMLFDVFETVVVPRRTSPWLRLAPFVIVWLWPIWRRIGMRRYPGWRREDFLGTFGPAVILIALAVWVIGLMLGFGLILHAQQDQLRPPLPDYGTAFYVAGTSLLTIGFGDFVPLSMFARITVLVAGAAGLATLALVISLTFNLYASFARREVLVLLLDSRAGVPPSGVMLLETYARHGIIPELAPAFASFESWTAEMLDSHLAYPLLPFFRSSHDNQSWLSTLGAVLDAATLMITAVEAPALDAGPDLRRVRAAAEMMYHVGCHALVDLTQNAIALRALKKAHDQPGIERAEFVTACRELQAAGYTANCSEESWQAFSRHRSVYASRLNLMARYLASPPTQWIGDRTVLPHFLVQPLKS